MKKLIVAAAAAFLLMFQSGCLFLAAGAAGAGTVAYTKGDFETTSEKPVGELYTVVEAACKEMDFEIYKQEQKEFSGLIVANSDFGKVAFTMKRKSEKETALQIRVGAFGDKDAQKLIYNKLKPKI